jgi:hypothetical protein
MKVHTKYLILSIAVGLLVISVIIFYPDNSLHLNENSILTGISSSDDPEFGGDDSRGEFTHPVFLVSQILLLILLIPFETFP